MTGSATPVYTSTFNTVTSTGGITTTPSVTSTGSVTVTSPSPAKFTGAASRPNIGVGMVFGAVMVVLAM